MKLKYFLFFIGLMICVHKGLVMRKPYGNILEHHSFSRIVTDREHRLLRLTLAEDEKYRIYTPMNKIPKSVINATMLFEDRYFYWHPGVNPFSLVRAFWITFVKGDRIVGASTITMQLSRQLYQLNSRTIRGKILQISKALQLEFLYSKEDILTAYLNIAPYGFNIEGIGAASRIYFKKPVEQLSLGEVLTLVVIPQSPYIRTRHIAKSQSVGKSLKNARNRLWQQWQKYYPETLASYQNVQMERTMYSPVDLPFKAPHFVTDLLQHTNERLLETTIDYPLQQRFNAIMQHYLKSKQDKGIDNAAILLIDSHTMEVLVSIGSADFLNDTILGQVNGVKARRSPGSALKPFAYAMAIDQGIIHPDTLLNDTPTAFGTYTPDNFDHNFVGPLTATDALVHSRNVPAIYLASQINSPSLYQFLQNAAIPLKHDSNHYGLSIVLGTAEVTMEELVKLYAILLNKGLYKSLVKRRGIPVDSGSQLLSPEASILTYDMLTQNPAFNRSYQKWLFNSYPVAWKTGTSVSYRDAWAIGMTGQYVIAVWIGDFKGKGNPAFVGRSASGPLLFQLIDALHRSKKVQSLPPIKSMGLNVKKVALCTISGQLPHADCPHRKEGWFIPGVSPFTRCTIHRKVVVDAETTMQVCPLFTGKTSEQIFEFWPSDIHMLFKQAGIERKTPPKLHPLCNNTSFGAKGPKITSPKADINYIIRHRGTGTNHIPLTAISEGNIKQYRWFVDHHFIGMSEANAVLLWKANAGNHLVQVVDEQGQWSEVEVDIKLAE